MRMFTGEESALDGSKRDTKRVGVVIPCHNDACLLDRVLGAAVGASVGFDSRTIVVADRCTDATEEIASRYCEVIVKSRSHWRNSIPENFNLGIERLLDREYLAIIASDMLVPSDFFSEGTRQLEEHPEYSSISSALYTEPSSFFNRLYLGYERALERAHVGKSVKRHGHRIYRMALLRKLFEERGYVFRDVMAEDAALDEEIGTVGVMEKVIVWHIRRVTLKKSIEGQIRSGRARRRLHRNLRSVLGEVLRLRFIVILSYLAAWREKD